MPFKLPDGRLISPDVAFTLDGIQYPANFLRLSTEEEKQALGIVLVPDPPVYDQRFYWGYDQDGQLIPKDHAQLVALWSETTRTTANTLLQPTDWVIIREADNGTAADPLLKVWRQDVRFAAGEKVTAIEATADTDALAAYITGAAYPVWPSQDPVPADDTIAIPDDVIASGGTV